MLFSAAGTRSRTDADIGTRFYHISDADTDFAFAVAIIANRIYFKRYAELNICPCAFAVFLNLNFNVWVSSSKA